MSYSKGASAQFEKINKKKKFYFLHGDDEAAIERAKSKVVDAHVAPEERDENYREIIPSTGQPLKRVLGDVLSELSTVSFLPGVNRVVTLYTVSDFFEARARSTARKKTEDTAKVSASEHLAQFIEKDLSSLPAVLIIIAVEDFEKFKRVNTRNPVFELAQKTGTVFQFKESSPQFGFFDALFSRKTEEAISLWRDWLERAPASPKPYMQLAAQVRLLLQAKIVASGQLQARGITKAKFAESFLPKDFDKNLFALKPDFRQEKLMRAAASFSFAELLGGYEELMSIQKFAIPLASDQYVPDRGLLTELWICKFTAGGRQ